jgi:excisionase family DNA binding protein
MEKLLSLSKAAEALGVTTQTLRNWDKAKKIKTMRTVGSHRRVPISEIERLQEPEEKNHD